MENEKYDVIIIGAGAAGLMAAYEISLVGLKAAVIESRDRIGGRIHTIGDKNFDQPVELGAEFIHGNLKQTLTFLKKAGLDYKETGGSIFRKEGDELKEQEDFIEDYSDLNKKFKALTHDISVAEFIDNYLQDKKFEELRSTLKNYIEGYYSAELKNVSTYALRDEMTSSDDEQYRPVNGYVKLLEYFEKSSKGRGTEYYLNEAVNKIIHRQGNVEVKTGNATYFAKKVLVTVSIGILRNEKIIFSPALPEKTDAAKKLGFGPVIKTILQFKTAFWKTINGGRYKDLGFLFSNEIIPTWWTQYPNDSAILTGWSGGPHALELKNMSKDLVLNKALTCLSKIFSLDMQELQDQLKGWHIADWIDDPHSFGAYSYDVVDGYKYKEIVRKPVNKTVYFAGEGLYDGPEIGTVEAALVNGRDMAYQLIADFKMQI